MGNYKKYIESNHKILLGKPIIKGSRISVELILKKFAEGASLTEMLDMYPHITKEQIYACLEYAADVVGKEEILELA